VDIRSSAAVTPDLATFGKALANGYPLSAVVGHAAVMDAAHRTWISSTLASEATALAAALAVLDWHEEADICATLAETGREMRAALDRAIAASGVSGVFTSGIDPMFLLVWEDPHREARFLAECARAGVILKRGAYNFAAVAHDEEAIARSRRQRAARSSPSPTGSAPTDGAAPRRCRARVARRVRPRRRPRVCC
jgi:glutamate-1-semialdehyde aminotransferase